jgi:hypothetical protein
MAAFTALAGAIGVASSLAGTAVSFMGQMNAQKEAKKQAAIARTQVNLEASRNRRQIIRQAMIARSEATSNATAQGAAKGSGLAGGLAQATAESGANVSNVNLGQQLSEQMYKSKIRASNAETLSSIGSGLSSLGGAFTTNQQEIGRLGEYATTPK